MAFILHYFAKFGSFCGPLRKSGLLAINRFSCKKCRSTPTKHDGRAVLFVVAELLVEFKGVHSRLELQVSIILVKVTR